MFASSPSSPLRVLRRDWRRLVVVFTPLILAALPVAYNTSEARCAYVILLMSVYYMTEALPLAVTALMPVFAFPLLGILSTDAVCRVYLRGTVMMFFGGLAVAIAVEHSNLHKRIALFVILKVGQSPRRLMVGFMVVAMFLSMWISNTAATAMMIPILDAILQELYKNQSERKKALRVEALKAICISTNSPILTKKNLPQLRDVGDVEKVSDPDSLKRSGSEERLLPPDKESEDLSTMFFLATAFGANLGGTGFPTGTSPNLVLWGILERSYPGGTSLDFATWMAFNVPGMLICVFITWIWLEGLYMGFGRCKKYTENSSTNEESIRRLVQKHYDSLGDITFHEICVTVLFGVLVFLWVFRSPEFITGWADVVQEAFGDDLKVGNATPGILVLFLLFVVPAQPPWENKTDEPTKSCLTWEAVHKKVPWGLMLLMGGGFAMAEGSSASGMSNLIKEQLQGLEVLPPALIVFIVCIITAFLTEIISNASAASILLPVLRDMAIAMHINPLYLMFPATLCCSYAFMLPVSNPPNAIVFNASTMKTSDLIKAGLGLKIFCVIVMTGLINTLGVYLFDLHTFPEWAGNSTIIEINNIQNETLLAYAS